MMYIAIGVVVVAAIILFIGLYKSFDVWHWVHILFVFLLFVAAIFAGNTLSKSFRIRSAWQKQYETNKTQYERLQQEVRELEYGDIDTISRNLDTVRGLETALQLELFGRGRVWRSGTPAVEGGKFSIQFPAADADPDGNLPPTAEQFRDGMLVYVFQDAPFGDQGTVPKSYLGVMRVVERQGDKVIVERRQTMDMQESTIEKDADGNSSIVKNPIFPEVDVELKTPSSTWTLFEKMPTDVGDAFKRFGGIEDDPLRDETVDIDAYQQKYRAVLAQFFNKQNLNLEENNPDHDRIFESIIDRYAFDGMKLSDINDWISRQPNRVSKEFDPSAEERFIRLRFEKKSAEYQVDSNTSNLKDGGAFDPEGRAQDPTLWVSPDGTGKVAIEAGQVIVVDPASAARLKSQETVTDEGEVYVRHLVDYPTAVSSLDQQREAVVNQTAKVLDEVAKLKVTTADLQTQETTRSRKRSQLTEDTDNLKKDVELVGALNDKLMGDVSAMKRRINELHKLINLRHEQIKQLSGNAIERNTSR